MSISASALGQAFTSILQSAGTTTGTGSTGPSRSTTAYILYANPATTSALPGGAQYSGSTSVPDLKAVSGSLGYGVSAITVNPGYSITIYTGTNYTGTQSTIQGPAYMNTIQKIQFNDNVKSIKVNTIGSTYTKTGKTVSATVQQTKALQNMDYSMCGRETICYNTNVATPTSAVNSAIDWDSQDPINCSIFEGDSRMCSPLDASVCPVMTSTADSVFWTSPTNDASPAGRSVTCTYDTGQFNNVAALNNWFTYPWTNQTEALQEYSQALMPAFCGQQVTTCQLNPITATQPAQCSRFSSSAADGNLCRGWVTNALNNTTGYSGAIPYTDQTMTGYCSKYNTSDCLCINRAQDPDYRQVTGVGTSTVNNIESFGKDSCWWKACQFPQQIMRTSDLNVVPGDCNIQLCQFLVNLQNTVLTTIDIGKIQVAQNCNFGSNTGGTQTQSSTLQQNGVNTNLPSGSGVTSNGAGATVIPPTGSGTSLNNTSTSPTSGTPTLANTTPTTTPTSTPTTTSTSKKWLYIIIAIVAIIILIIVGIAIYLLSRSSTAASSAAVEAGEVPSGEIGSAAS